MPKQLYGLNWPDEMTAVEVELFCFRVGTGKCGGEPDNPVMHFKNLVRMYWGPKSKKHFIWNPWNEKMLEYACKHRWLNLSGCASSQKTVFGAVWGIINWLCMPTKTLVLFTSTSLSESRMRIWGTVEDYFMAAQNTAVAQKLPTFPGKLLGSTGKVRVEVGGQRYSDKSGLHLIPGDRAKEKENIGKLIGLKNERVILIGDEMPELSPALTEAALSNLITNPYFQMIGIGNFNSIYDPFGVECTPKAGWGSVNDEMDEWETSKGVCLRFDGLKSPNVLLGEEKYPGLYSSRHLKEHREGLGEHSARFWRMCRSYPCPEADANRIYSEADFLKGQVHGTVKWIRPPIKVAVIDPAYATGGDKAIARFGLLGDSAEGKRTLQFTERLDIREDIRIKDKKRALQTAEQFRDACIARDIAPQNAAYDASGAGSVFGELLAEIWSPLPYGIQCGGGASMRPAGSKDKRPGRDAYSNRIAEIWFSGLEYVQSGQIKGLDSDAAKDLKERRYDTIKGANGLKIRVETKADMKGRIGHSPDDGDAAMLLLELCKERFRFYPDGLEGRRAVIQDTWKKRALVVNNIYANADAYEKAA